MLLQKVLQENLVLSLSFDQDPISLLIFLFASSYQIKKLSLKNGMKTSTNPAEYAKLMVHKYGKNSLRKTVDNLSDVFLALR